MSPAHSTAWGGSVWGRPRPAAPWPNRSAWPFLLLLAAWLSCLNPLLPETRAALRPLPTVRMNGQDYVDLAAWARLNDLTWNWNRPTRDVNLTNRATRLQFNVNSRLVSVNGVKCWLSLPLLQVGERLHLSVLDRRTLLAPILAPARNRPGQRVRVIAIDPGHGGSDTGYVVGQKQEKVYTLLLAKKLQALLKTAGIQSFLIRSTDVFIDLEERPAIARRRRADLFVSLHFNAGGNSGDGAQGIETYVLTPPGVRSTNLSTDTVPTKAYPGNLQNSRSALLAYQVQKALIRNLDAEDRGVRRARFAVLRPAEMPAILIEAGFLSDPGEAKRILDPEHRGELARSILDGILAYKRLVERP